MSYQLRNSITLGTILLVITIVGGYVTYFQIPAELTAMEKERKKVNRMVKYLENIESQYPEVSNQLSEAKVKIQNVDKQITGVVSASDVYADLNQIMEGIGGLDINLSKGGIKRYKDYGYQMFNIQGEGAFNSIYQFLWQIERGERVFKLNNVNLKGIEVRDDKSGKNRILIQFSAQLWAYYAQLEDLPLEQKPLKLVKVASASDIFRPSIKRNLPPNRKNLVEVNRSRLKAVLADRILIHDQSGSMKMLRVGEAVYLGYLTSIDPRNNQAEFTLNMGGVMEKVRLNLDLTGGERKTR